MDSDAAEKSSKTSNEVKEESNEVVEEKEQETAKVQKEEESSDSGAVIINDVPSDKVNIRLLRINGNKSDILVNSKDTIETVKKHILESWPKGWTDEVPTAIENIKLLHYGKYLDDNTTVEDNKIPEGQTTIVHIIIKFTKKEDEKEKDETKEASSCCCIIS
ncbi:hypothetical protein BCR36DRAFT_369760 [Piromyces finnis]|uniref:Ubiquitin-like domain-containing protein n=1 Tax=Piromyces finnis TaxID=1754191 RepID=A0A1Y1VBB6_9FUNG|nr:hypothetical protein BCR36DRAFT_369760 [Piromyces finnis]|eukprot:ORX51852.1 hypothetical protein BCR36DRAFT_369760 [Piromyces finnis]